MAKSQGLIGEIKEQSTAYGTMYNYVINGETFGAGKFPPKGVAVGDYIEFEFVEKGRYKNLESKSVRKVEKPSGEQVATATAATATAVRSFGKDQDTISKQAARNTAVAFLTLLASQDAIPVAASAKPAARFDAIRGMLEKLTQEFYDYSTGKSPTPLTDAAEPATMAEPADGPWVS